MALFLIPMPLTATGLAQSADFRAFFPTLNPVDYVTLGESKIFLTGRGILWDSGEEILTEIISTPHTYTATSGIPVITTTLTLKRLPELLQISAPGVPLMVSQDGMWILTDTASGPMLWCPVTNQTISVNINQPILAIWNPPSANPELVTTSGVYKPSGESIITASSPIVGVDTRKNLVMWSSTGDIWTTDSSGQVHHWNIRGITDAGACNPPIAMTDSGSLYSLTSTIPNWMASLPPNSYILGCYVVTPLGTFSATGGTLKRYSSWLKSVQIQFTTTYKGEVVLVPLQKKPIISAEDFSFLNGNPIPYTHDDDRIQATPTGISINGKILIPLPAVAACQSGEDLIYVDQSGRLNGTDWKIPLSIQPVFLGCSPTEWAAVGTEKTVIGDTKTGETLATIQTPSNATNIYYAQGYIWISTPDGVFRLPIYQKRIELIIGSVMVKVNGKEKYIDVAPRILPPGRTFVPLRFVSESMGAKVVWHPNTRTIDIELGEHIINLKIGSTTATVDGTPKQLDAAPFIDTEANRTLVPIRFVAEFLGAKVYWIGRLRKVIIVR